MAYITEGSPIRKVSDLEIAESPDAKRIARLEAGFPGKVEVIPAGSVIFHHSNSLRGLVNRGVFDYTLSRHEGAYFFSDLPAIYANCIVGVESGLVLFNYNDMNDEEIKELSNQGNGNWWSGGANAGFDGRTFVTPDPFVEITRGRYGTEIVVFKPSLRKLGKITPLVPLQHPLRMKR